VCVNPLRVEEPGGRAKKWLLLNHEHTPPELRHMFSDPGFFLFYQAPALIMVLATSSESQATEDCGLAAENLILAARDKGLASCWIGLARPWLDLVSTKRELGLRETYRVVAPIILGYPSEWPQSHDRNTPEILWIE
jgi:nitroreductase